MHRTVGCGNLFDHEQFRHDNTIGRRAKRYARVGGTVGGLAAKFVGSRYLGFDLDNEKHAGELAAALGGLKGPLMKVAQLMATIPDALPDEYVAELKQLQSDAPRWGGPLCAGGWLPNLGSDWRKRFEAFDGMPRMRPWDKSIARPGRTAISTPASSNTRICRRRSKPILRSSIWFLRFMRVRIKRSTPVIYIPKFPNDCGKSSTTIWKGDTCRFAGHAVGRGGCSCAGTHPRSLPGRLLTMTWLDGEPLLNYAEAPLEVRNAVAANMFRAWYVPFYYYAVIHGDPHLGNYSVRDDQSINLMDFGCIRKFDASFVRGVIDLYYALRDNDRNRCGLRVRDLGLFRDYERTSWTS